MSALTATQAHRAYRESIDQVAIAKHLVGKLVDFDLTAADLIGDLDRVMENLEEDRIAYRDELQ